MQTATLDLAFPGLTVRHSNPSEAETANGSFLDQLGPEMLGPSAGAMVPPDPGLTIVPTALPKLALPIENLNNPALSDPDLQFAGVPSLRVADEVSLADPVPTVEIAKPALPMATDQQVARSATSPQGQVSLAASVQHSLPLTSALPDLPADPQTFEVPDVALIATAPAKGFALQSDPQVAPSGPVPTVQPQATQTLKTSIVLVPAPSGTQDQVTAPAGKLDLPLGLHLQPLDGPPKNPEFVPAPGFLHEKAQLKVAPTGQVPTGQPQATQPLKTSVVLVPTPSGAQDQVTAPAGKLDLPLGLHLQPLDGSPKNPEIMQASGLLHEKAQETAVRLRWEGVAPGKMIFKAHFDDQIAQTDMLFESTETAITAHAPPLTTAQPVPQVATIAAAGEPPAKDQTQAEPTSQKPAGTMLPLATAAPIEVVAAPVTNPPLVPADSALQNVSQVVAITGQGATVTNDATLPIADLRPMRQAELPGPVQQTAAILAAQKPDQPGRIELTLTPESLGRLHFDMRPEGAAMAITLSAERPETLDLMRRHLPELMAELKQLGVEAGTLAFGSWSEGRQAPAKPPDPPPSFAADLPQAPVVARPRQASPSVAGGLDLRF